VELVEVDGDRNFVLAFARWRVQSVRSAVDVSCLDPRPAVDGDVSEADDSAAREGQVIGIPGEPGAVEVLDRARAG
jgi:hypothetical protein